MNKAIIYLLLIIIVKSKCYTEEYSVTYCNGNVIFHASVNNLEEFYTNESLFIKLKISNNSDYDLYLPYESSNDSITFFTNSIVKYNFGGSYFYRLGYLNSIYVKKIAKKDSSTITFSLKNDNKQNESKLLNELLNTDDFKSTQFLIIFDIGYYLNKENHSIELENGKILDGNKFKYFHDFVLNLIRKKIVIPIY